MNVLADKIGNQGAECYLTGPGLSLRYVTEGWEVNARIIFVSEIEKDDVE